MHRRGDEEIVECLHPQTGTQYWQFRYPTDYVDQYGFSNGPRSSPVLDGDRVYTLGVLGMLHCLDLHDGKVLWKRNINEEYGLGHNYFGTGTSPLVYGDLLIVNIGAPGPCVVAFDKRSGKVVWSAGHQWGQSYATPVPATIHSRPRIVVFAGGDVRPPTGGLLAIDPADGKIDLRFPFRGKRYESVNAVTPLVVGDDIFVTSSYRTGSAFIHALEGGGYKELWNTRDFKAHWTTPIVENGYLYGYSGTSQGNAAIVCLDLKTGKAVWQTQPEWTETIKHNGKSSEATVTPMRGSIIRAGNRFVCLGERGYLLLLNLTPKGCTVLERARLFDATETWSAPVLSHGLLYVAQNRPTLDKKHPRRLLCLDLRGQR